MRPAPVLLTCLLALSLAGAEPAMSKEDQAEFDALRARIRRDTTEVKPTATPPAATPPPAKTVRVQVIRSDRENVGFELVLVLDIPVPVPAIIRGSGHAVGEKLAYEGAFEGAARFEGAYYPFLKSTVTAAPVVAPPAAAAAAEPDPIVSDMDEQALETAPGFNAFTLSKIIFAAFAVVSIAIVVLKTKAKIEERAIKRHRKR